MDVAIVVSSRKGMAAFLAVLNSASQRNPVLASWLEVNRAVIESNLAFPEDVLIRDALRARGVDAALVPVDDAAMSWAGVKLCIVRSASEFLHRTSEFLEWAQSTQRVTTLWNPLEAMRWISNKTYLKELEGRGVPSVPTRVFRAGDRAELAELLQQENWDEAVVKPLTGAGGATNTVRTSRSELKGFVRLPEAQAHLEKLLASSGALVQPFFRSVETAGEISVIFMHGRPTHAVKKFANDGDFIATGHPVSRQEAIPLSKATSEFAMTVLGAIGTPVQFGRIDVISGNSQEPLLLEVELVTPRLFLECSPEALELFVERALAELRA